MVVLLFIVERAGCRDPRHPFMSGLPQGGAGYKYPR